MDTMLSLLAHTKEDFFMLYTAVTNDWGETTYIPTTPVSYTHLDVYKRQVQSCQNI